MHFHWLLIINAWLPVPPCRGRCLFCCGRLWLGAPRRCRGAACRPARAGEGGSSCQADPASSDSWT